MPIWYKYERKLPAIENAFYLLRAREREREREKKVSDLYMEINSYIQTRKIRKMSLSLTQLK